MKIWFDLSNSPHVNMFYDMILELESLGHEVIITCRPLANTIELLDQKKLTYTVIGKHYGKSLYRKIIGFPVRVFQLYKYLSKIKPDVSVSQSSFHSPLVARFLRIPSIYTNDNEHALGNKVCFYFATKILIPENFSFERAVKLGGRRSSIIQYPGVKEGLYLWKKGEMIHHHRKNTDQKAIKIYVRPEPQTAQYYKGGFNFMDKMLEELQSVFTITILCRNVTQYEHYKQLIFSKLQVPKDPLEFDQIAEDCTLFIGAGGSMTREFAILGVPAISVYQDELLEVDKLLIRKQLMLHLPNLGREDVVNHILSLHDKQPDLELMEKGRKAYILFRNEILKFNKSDSSVSTEILGESDGKKPNQLTHSRLRVKNQRFNN